MTPEASSSLSAVIAAYLQGVDAGQPPDRAELRARHPDLAEELQQFFAAQDAVDQVAQPLRQAVASVPAEITIDSPENPRSGRGFEPDRVTYFGDYELHGEIARGGMGVVYRARQVSVNRPVALKMILAGQLATATDIQRFRSEAETAANLDHPHIVPIYDVGEQAGQHYFSMKLIEGGGLNTGLHRYHDDPRAAAQLLATVARAVHHAHQRGLLHRDLKPGNILVDKEGQPHVTDFGLAKRLSSDGGVTQTGAIVGTPEYMAPEQAAGHRDLTTAADVYSLGAVFYALLTGRPPFRGETVLATLKQVQEQEPVPPRELNPKVERDLDIICRKCLEKDPIRRYGSAAALADDLQRWLKGEPIQARAVGRWERLRKWARRRPAAAALLAVLVLATISVTGLVSALWYQAEERAQTEGELKEQVQLKANSLKDLLGEQGRLNQQLQKQAATERDLGRQVKQERDHAQEQSRLLEKQLLRAEWLIYAGKITQAQREWLDHRPARARELLEDTRWDFRGWEHRYLYTHFHHLGQRTFHGLPGWVTSVAFSPDGKVVLGKSGATVQAWDLHSGRELWTFTAKREDATSPNVVVSADFQQVADRDYRHLKSWDPRSGKLLLHLQPHENQPVSFSPDGALLACLEGSFYITLLDARTGAEKHRVAGTAPLAFDRAGQLVVVCSQGNAMKVWDLQMKKEVFNIQNLAEPVASVALSPDGQLVAAGIGAGDLHQHSPRTVKVWEVRTGKEIHTLRGHTNGIGCLAFSPDSKQLVTGSGDYSVKLWDLTTGQELATFQGHTVVVSSVAFSPDGQHIVSGSWDQTVKVWDVAVRQRPLQLTAHATAVSSLDFSPDGNWLVTTGRDQTIRMWNAHTGQESARFRGPEAKAVNVEGFRAFFSPDGRQLVSKDGETFHLRDAQTGATLHALKPPQPLFTCAACSPDGESMVRGCLDHTVRIGGQLANHVNDQPLCGHTGTVTSVAWAAERRQVASGSADHTVRVWHVSSEGKSLTLVGHQAPVTSVSFGSGDNLLASGDATGLVKLWQLPTGKELLSVQGHGTAVSCLTFSRSGRMLVSGDAKGTLTVWNARTGLKLHDLAGHQAALTGLVFCPIGEWLISASADHTLRVWDTRTWQESRVFREHRSRVTCVALSPDGRWVASAGQDRAVKVWERQTGQVVFHLEALSETVDQLAFQNSGRRLLGFGRDYQGTFWNLDFAYRQPSPGDSVWHSNSTLPACAFSPDSKQFAGSVHGSLATIWDAQSGQPLCTLIGHTHPISAIRFSPDGKRLATGSWDKTVKIWDARTGQHIRTLSSGDWHVKDLAFSPVGERLASVHGGSVRTWDLRTGELLRILKVEQGPVRAYYSPDGKKLAASISDAQVQLRVWDAESGQELAACAKIGGLNIISPDWRCVAGMFHQVKVFATETGQELLQLQGSPRGDRALAFSPDGARLAAGGEDGIVRLWSSHAPQKVLPISGLSGAANSVAFSPDGQRLASASLHGGGMVGVWNSRTGRLDFTDSALRATRQGRGFTSVVFSRAGKRMAAGSGIFEPSEGFFSGPGKLHIWDAQTGKELRTLPAHEQPTTQVAFSPDGQRLATASDEGAILLWDAESGQKLLQLAGASGNDQYNRRVVGLAFSPDGQQLISNGGWDSVKVWDLKTGREVLAWTVTKIRSEAVSCLALSPDGKRLAVGCGTSVQLWDLQTGKETLTLPGHPELVNCVAFSPDGQRLAVGCGMLTLKIWEAKKGQELLTLQHGYSFSALYGNGQYRITGVAFSPDGTRLLSGDGMGGLKLWLLDQHLAEAQVSGR